jgi:hypothetical protein
VNDAEVAKKLGQGFIVVATLSAGHQLHPGDRTDDRIVSIFDLVNCWLVALEEVDEDIRIE